MTNNDGAAVSYDASGNRTVGGYVVGAGNRVTGDGTWTYTYDDTGAVTGKSKSGEAWAYTYDLNGQMTSASKSATVGGAVTDAVAYTYDAWGNRVSRTQSGTTSSTERYVVDGWDTAKGGAVGTENFDTTIDLNSSNAVTERRLFGAGFDAAVARRDAGGAVSWYGADGLGSVRQVFDNSGSVTGSRSFDGFGNVTATSGTGLDRYGYTGTVTDALTGLVGDNARSYDPTTGRWLSEDPKGFDAGDVNLHRYVGNNATGGRDPSGMENPFIEGFVRGLLGPGAPAVQQGLGGSMIGGVAGIAAGVARDTADWTDRTFVNPPPPPTDAERIERHRWWENWFDSMAQGITRNQRDLEDFAHPPGSDPTDRLGGRAVVGIVNSLAEIPKAASLYAANRMDVGATRIAEANGTNTGPSSGARRYSFNMALLTENPLAKLWRTNVPDTGSQYMNLWAYEAEAAAPRNYQRGAEAAPGLQEFGFLLFDIGTLAFPGVSKLLRGFSLAEKLAPRALRVGGEVGLERMNIAARISGQAEKQACNSPGNGFKFLGLGKDAPPPTGPLDDALRAAMMREAQSFWFRLRTNVWSRLTGQGKINWTGFMDKLSQAEFRKFASVKEAKPSGGGWAGPSGGGNWLFGVRDYARPLYGKSVMRHELFHAVQDFLYGLYSLPKNTATLWGKIKVVGRTFRVEYSANLVGGPLIGAAPIFVLNFSIAGAIWVSPQIPGFVSDIYHLVRGK